MDSEVAARMGWFREESPPHRAHAPVRRIGKLAAMFRPHSPRSQPPPGTIDFEPTDIEEARASHDAFPPGVSEFARMQPGYWEKRRRPPLVTDRALTGRSLEWLLKLPPLLRPKTMCDRFPRIVNSLSETWADVSASLDLFEHLLNDRRTGRRGFPADVHDEIEALLAHRIELASIPPST